MLEHTIEMAIHFSSVGSAIDIFALGENIAGPNCVDTTLEDSNFYKYLRQDDGTSFAAPAVGALICLILEAVKDTCRREHYDQIKLLLKLATEKRVISCKQLDKFFNKDSRFYLGPNHFIQEMVSSREIQTYCSRHICLHPALCVYTYIS